MATLNRSKFPDPEIVECSKCRAETKLFDPEGSEYFVCKSCKSLLRFTTNDLPLVQQNVSPPTSQPVLPLGAEGTLKGHQFRVIAYLEKKERDTVYGWREYLLYNYKKGYATLAEFDGHWNYIIGKEWEAGLASLESNSKTAKFEGEEYRLFNKYRPVTLAAIGEFDWDVFKDSPRTNEYIAPPYSIARESDGAGNSKATFYLGEYVEPEEISKAFGIELSKFPERQGIGSTQPSAAYEKFSNVKPITIYAIVAVLSFYLLIYFFKPERVLLEKDFTVKLDLSSLPKLDSATTDLYTTTNVTGNFDYKPFMTDQFTQSDASSAMEISVQSSVDNSWLEATVVLVNEATNETWEVTKGIEYYHGYEDGESWTEGSNETSMILSAIPAGKYHLNIYPAAGDTSQTLVRIKVTSNIVMWRNILITLLLLLIYPAWCYFRYVRYEYKRWENSDFSPYSKYEE